jgi:hypothetical protein
MTNIVNPIPPVIPSAAPIGAALFISACEAYHEKKRRMSLTIKRNKTYDIRAIRQDFAGLQVYLVERKDS